MDKFQEEIDLLYLNSRNGNDESQIILFLHLYFGIKMLPHEKEAIAWCFKSVERGNLFAMGIRYFFGFEIPLDYERAYQFISEHVARDNRLERKDTSYALNFLGYMYKNAKGIDRDFQKASALFHKSVELGNSMAMYNYAYMYENGQGIEKNIKEAKRLYKRASELGNGFAMNNLAFLYENSEGGEVNYEKALNYYHKSIEFGMVKAYYNLALMYEKGKGTKVDYSIAIDLYRKGSEYSLSSSLNNLALMYEDGKGLNVDYDMARELYLKAIKLGNATSMNNLGLMYQKGRGVKKNIDMAIQYYLRSIEDKNTFAMSNLGHLYEHGEGVEVNYDKAAHYYHMGSLIHDSNKSDLQQRFENVLNNHKVSWKQEYHEHWNKATDINPRLVTLLLISKFRQESVKKETLYIVKGIVMNIIKRFCDIEY